MCFPILLWLFDAHAFFNLINFFFRNWRWRGVGADKSGYARRVADDIPCLIGQFHLYQHVALENFDINNLTLAVLNLDLLFLRHHNIKDLVYVIFNLLNFLFYRR